MLNRTITNRTISFLLIFVFAANLLGTFFFLPRQEAQALDSVIIIKNTDPLEAMYKTYDKFVQSGQFAEGTISAGVDVWDKALTIAKGLANLAIQQMLQRILMMITNDIIKWINGGGTPKFVSDWQGFLRDAANQAGATFLQTLGLGFLCQPFAAQLRLALMPVPYQQMARCTLQDMGRNMQNFFSNFASGGGWGTWLQVIQPQNNFYGALVLAQDEMNRQKLAAAQAAQNEALSGGGFLGAKKCDQCRVENLISGSAQTFSGIDACDAQKKSAGASGDATFTCQHEIMQTPPSVVQYEAQKAIDSGRQLIQDQIANLTGNTDIMGIKIAPFISAILGALVNRVITGGLGMLTGVMGSNNSGSTNYYYDAAAAGQGNFATPDQNQNANSQGTQLSGLEMAQNISATSPNLINAQGLLKDNLQNELLPQQQKNLDVLNSTNNVQTQTLQALKNIVAKNCSLPSWVSSQILSDNGTTQVVKLTADGIGSITVARTLSSSGIGSSSSATVQEILPAIAPQATAMANDVATTQQMISVLNDSVTVNKNGMAEADTFNNLYEQASFNPTTEINKNLDNETAKLTDIYNAIITNAQKAADSQETDLSLLLAATNEESQAGIQDGQTAESSRDSLNSQLSAAQAKQSEAQTALATCQTNF